MTGELVLKYEELYFLGEILGAEYIDYDYITAMGDIQNKHDYLRREAINSMSQQGYLKEMIGHKMTVSENIKMLVDPVFWGAEEITFSMVESATRKVTRKKIHKNKNNMTMVSQLQSACRLKSVTTAGLEEMIHQLADGLSFAPGVHAPQAQFTRLIEVQRAKVDAGRQTVQFIELGGLMYGADPQGNPVGISREDFCSQIEAVVKGAEL